MAEKVYIKEPPYNPDDPDPGPPPSMEEVEAWEAANSRLPDDYKAFITTYKGGTVWPMLFETNTEDPTEDFIQAEEEEAVDTLFHWSEFADKNRIDNTHNLRQFNLLPIGYDTTGSSLCLSLAQADFGAVRWFWRNMANWDEDEDGPMPIGTVAPSFRAFIYEALFDDGDGGPRWYIPRDLETAKQVEF